MSENYFSRKEKILSGSNLKPLSRQEMFMQQSSEKSEPQKLYLGSAIYDILFGHYMEAVQAAVTAYYTDSKQAHTYSFADLSVEVEEGAYEKIIESLYKMNERGYGSAYVGDCAYPLTFVDPGNINNNGDFAFMSTYMTSSEFNVITAVVALYKDSNTAISVMETVNVITSEMETISNQEEP